MPDEQTGLTIPDKGGVAPANTGEISGLMELAITQKLPVEVLEKLVALQERVTDRQARTEFFKALHAFQSEVGPVPKTKGIPSKEVNRDGTVKMRSHFAPLPVIANHIREPLAKNGLSYWWDSSVDGEMVTIRCHLQHVDGYSQTSEFTFPTKDAAAPKMTGVQISGSARSYGERYSLIQVTGLTTADEDIDGSGDEDSEDITEGMVEFLKTQLKDTDADVPAFLAFFSIESVERLPQSDFRRAVVMLERKAKEASGED